MMGLAWVGGITMVVLVVSKIFLTVFFCVSVVDNVVPPLSGWFEDLTKNGTINERKTTESNPITMSTR